MMTPEPIEPDGRSLDELLPELIQQGNETASSIESLGRSIDRQTRARWWNNAVGLLLLLLMALVVADNRVGLDRLQGKLCPLVALLGTESGSAAPSTPRGRDIAAASDRLADDWRCQTPDRSNQR